MEGKYYTIDIAEVQLLDYFGGFRSVSLGDYLQYSVANGTEGYFDCSLEDSDPKSTARSDTSGYHMGSIDWLLGLAAFVGWGLFVTKICSKSQKHHYQRVTEVEMGSNMHF